MVVFVLSSPAFSLPPIATAWTEPPAQRPAQPLRTYQPFRPTYRANHMHQARCHQPRPHQRDREGAERGIPSHLGCSIGNST